MSSVQIDIRVDDLCGLEIADFLQAHMDDMHSASPPESIHALDLEALKGKDITFWTAWIGDELVGCGALKALGDHHGELKSMRSATNRRGAGIGYRILNHILDEARNRGYRKVSLETGSMDFFRPARHLYERAGFSPCPPFGEYQLDVHSVFYEMVLG